MELSNDQFKILGSETLYKSKKLQIDSLEILLPNGNVVKWDVNVLPSFYYGIPIRDGRVILTREWREGPGKILTQFTAARMIFDEKEKNLDEIRREMREEMGLEGGEIEELITFPWGFRTTGNVTYVVVKNFKIGETNRDENEIQEIIELPIKGLYNELLQNHAVTSDTLLVAKLLEEKYI
jgi:hypothetical protein